MSKMDELRALREARWEHTLARAAAHRAGATGTSTPNKTQRPAARPAAPERPEPGEPERPTAELPELTEAVEERLCGHRAISGRTCTREHGHAAKSHRYS